MRFQAVLGFVLVSFLCVQKARNNPIERPSVHHRSLLCPPLRCPSLDDGCTGVVSPFYWHSQKDAGGVVPCRACDQCVDDRPAAASASSGPPGVKQHHVPLGSSSSGCLPLPCPLPPSNCTHLVQTFYWDTRGSGDEVLCPGCEVCGDLDVKDQQQTLAHSDPAVLQRRQILLSTSDGCLPLPCPPPPPNCTHLVQMFYWAKQDSGNEVLCPSCEVCTDPNVKDQQQTAAYSDPAAVQQHRVPLSSSDGCLPLPCPPPPPNCTHLVQMFYWAKQDSGNEVLCPSCEVCTDPNVKDQQQTAAYSDPAAVQQHRVPLSSSDGCLPLPCPPPPPNCTHLVQMFYWAKQDSGDEVLCPSCQLCTDPNVKDQQQTAAYSDPAAVQQHRVPLSTSDGCLPLPCPPPPPNCTHLVRTFFWDRRGSGDEVLCPSCQLCTDPNVKDQQQTAAYSDPAAVQQHRIPLSSSDGCLPLPCPPPPPNCTHLVRTFYWDRRGSGDDVLCPGCVMCTDPTVKHQQHTAAYSNPAAVQQHQVPLSSSSGCLPLPCPGPPRSNCTHLVQTFYWERQGSGNKVLCPGCDVCADPSVKVRHATRDSGSPAVKQVNRQVPLVVQDGQGCPEVRCPVPIANCTHFVPLHYWHKAANGNLILCRGCDTCYSDERVASSVTQSSVPEPEAPDSPVKQPEVSKSTEKRRGVPASPEKQPEVFESTATRPEVLNLQGKQLPVQESQGCPEVRCLVPIANCTHFVPLHYWHKAASGNLILCRGCDTCYSDKDVASSPVTQSSVPGPESLDSPVKQPEVSDSPDKRRDVADSPEKQPEVLNLRQGKQPKVPDSPVKQPDDPNSPEVRDVPFSPWCPPPPCPPPPQNCTHFEQTFYWNRQDSGAEVLCPGCDMCVYP